MAQEMPEDIKNSRSPQAIWIHGYWTGYNDAEKTQQKKVEPTIKMTVSSTFRRMFGGNHGS